MMFCFMFESSQTHHDVYLACMSLCIIMLELLLFTFVFAVFFRVCRLLLFPFLDVAHPGCFILEKTNSRMMRGGSSSHACKDVPVRRSARQAGHSPEPYPPPPPPPSHPPSTKQIMRMFEERRNIDLIELLKSVQAMVGQNGNQNGHHSKLSYFQRIKPPSFSQVIDPLEADDWLQTIEKKLEIARTEEADKVPFATHYLEGAAAIWWDNDKAMWPADEEITRNKFKDHFRNYHIPAGIMNVK